MNQVQFAQARIKETPKYTAKTITDKFGHMRYEGYFLIFDNGKGSEIVRIFFSDQQDAVRFINAVNKQFLHK